MFYNVWRLWSYKVRRSVIQAVHWVPARRLLCLMVENHWLCQFVAEARACKQVVSSKVPAFRLLLAIVDSRLKARMRKWFLLTLPLLYVIPTVGALPHTLTNCDTYWCGPHMCHNLCHICGTYVTHMWYHICDTYVSHLVPHMCHNLYQISVTFCHRGARFPWNSQMQALSHSITANT